jgi:hypothetical protein
MCAQTIENVAGPDSYYHTLSLKAAAMHAIRPDLACRAFAEQGRPREKVIVDREARKDGRISISVIRMRPADATQSGDE